MGNKNLTTTITVDNTPREAFEAIKNVRKWWSTTIEGPSQEVGDIFTYEVPGVHTTKMQLVQVVPNKKLVWHVLENWFSFTDDKNEWVDNNLVFNISQQDGQTIVQFTQVGLTNDDECYDICNGAWAGYVNGSLHKLITTGTGDPSQEKEADLAELRA